MRKAQRAGRTLWAPLVFILVTGDEAPRTAVKGLEPPTFTLATCTGVHRKQMHDSGLEMPDTREPAESAAAKPPDGLDDGLRAVVESWHTLPQHIRETMRTLVEASRVR